MKSYLQHAAIFLSFLLVTAPQNLVAQDQKSILVTGASTGIGRHLAESLAADLRLASTRPIPDDYIELANRYALQSARIASMPSVMGVASCKWVRPVFTMLLNCLALAARVSRNWPTSLRRRR